ncbi:MAG: type VI secretion system tube protein Hcp [Dehalococcoidia bacterium]|nr:MAG: type VI secretion system tube protein Hcp [Dehalococcoidia bacterium]
MLKFLRKNRIFSFSMLLISIILASTLIVACNGFDINPFDDETTSTSTTKTVSELPGKTAFTTTSESPSNGIPLTSPAVDMFLQIDGLSGESTDADHVGWIDVLSYEWGVSQPSAGVISSGISRSSERALHTDFTITKTLDKTSPKLALYCSKGQHVSEATLVICHGEGGGQIMEYRMTDLIISSVLVSGTAGQEILPTEQIGLAYTEIEWIYTERDELGMAMGNVEAYWNLETSTGE